MKMWDPLLKTFGTFKMATAEHLTESGALLSTGPWAASQLSHEARPRVWMYVNDLGWDVKLFSYYGSQPNKFESHFSNNVCRDSHGRVAVGSLVLNNLHSVTPTLACSPPPCQPAPLPLFLLCGCPVSYAQLQDFSFLISSCPCPKLIEFGEHPSWEPLGDWFGHCLQFHAKVFPISNPDVSPQHESTYHFLEIPPGCPLCAWDSFSTSSFHSPPNLPLSLYSSLWLLPLLFNSVVQA